MTAPSSTGSAFWRIPGVLAGVAAAWTFVEFFLDASVVLQPRQRSLSAWLLGPLYSAVVAAIGGTVYGYLTRRRGVGRMWAGAVGGVAFAVASLLLPLVTGWPVRVLLAFGLAFVGLSAIAGAMLSILDARLHRSFRA